MTSYPFADDPYQNKLVTVEEMTRIVSQMREEGKTSVFTNGCFDLLHVGHIRALRHARALGDALLVAVNSDASVKSYKGEHLPVVPEKERLEVLSTLNVIDYLILFEETSVDLLLGQIRPHIHAKGTDYTKETVPERDTVLAYGGEIAIVGDPKLHSTTTIIEKIQAMPNSSSSSRGRQS